LQLERPTSSRSLSGSAWAASRGTSTAREIPTREHEGAETLEYDGHEIDLFAVWPLHADEMQVKLDEGLDRRLDLLDDASIIEIVDPDRPSVVPRRRRRAFFRR